MSILIINYKSKDLADYGEWLKDLNEDLILLNAKETINQYSPEDFVHMESFDNYDDESYRFIRAIELYEQYKYHTIIALYELDLLPASQIREKFGLKGQTYHSSLTYRNKILMKELAQKNGLKTPAFVEIHSVFDLYDFIQKHSYPVIVKPIDKAGSLNTMKLENENDMRELVQKGIPYQMEVEKFVDGELYHLDGLIIDNELKFISASKYIDGSTLSNKEGGYTGSYLIHESNPLFERLTSYTKELIASLDTPESTTFHAELFHTKDDEIVLCEIASRTGGTRVNVVCKEGYGVDLNKTIIRTHCNLPIDLPPKITQTKLAGWLIIPPKKGKLVSVPQKKPPTWVTEYILVAQSGQEYDSPKESVDTVATFVVEGESETEVQERIHSCINWFNENSEWEVSDTEMVTIK